MGIARAARDRIRPDKLIWIPSKTPPHRGPGVLEAEERLRMLRAWASGRKWCEVSDLELRKGHSGFTVETLEIFSSEYPGAELYFLMGNDEAVNFGSWKEPERILELARPVIARRSGTSRRLPGEIAARSVFLENPEFDISSSEVRRRLRRGEDAGELLDPFIYRYIMDNSLYAA